MSFPVLLPRPQRLFAASLLTLILAAGCTPDSLAAPSEAFPEELLESASILNSTPTDGFRSVGHLCSQHPSLEPWENDPLFTIVDDWLCYPASAVLITPTVAVTVAHAAPFYEATGATKVGVQFAPTWDDPDAPIMSGTFTEHPAWDPNNSFANDIAVIVFDQPVTGIRTARLPYRINHTDRYVEGRTSATLVGYGLTSLDGFPTAPEWGVKTKARTTVGQIEPSYLTSTIGRRGDGTGCIGESGAPMFHGGGFTQIMVGIGSTAGDPQCAWIAYSRLDTESVRDFLADYLPEHKLPRGNARN